METTRKKSVIREVSSLKRLDHPNIMKLYDVIDTQKQLFLIMEYVPGQMLSSYLRELLQQEKKEQQQQPESNNDKWPSTGPTAQQVKDFIQM